MRDRAVAPVRALAKPPLARAEIVDKATRSRLEAELDGAIKRRPANERKLAGVLRALAPLSPSLRAAMADAAETFLRRGTLDRDLYTVCMRSVGEARDKACSPLIRRALALDSAGGAPALSAAGLSSDPSLGPLLAKVAAGHKAHLAFAAETARVTRGEANGNHLLALAPMIKESHRLTLCAEIFVPLARQSATLSAPSNLRNAAPALAVLRGAERHLGRWLVLGEVAAASGDTGPLEDAVARSTLGPTTARSAWSLVAWALETRMAHARVATAATGPQPTVRPTVEIRVSTLRPSERRPGHDVPLSDGASAPAVGASDAGDVRAGPPVGDRGVGPGGDVLGARPWPRGSRGGAPRHGVRRAQGRSPWAGHRGAVRSWRSGPLARGPTHRRGAPRVALARHHGVGGAVRAAMAASSGSGAGEAEPEGVASESAHRWMQWGWLE